ncbi:MAG: hypothetical protein M9950_07175 [Thermomicrobiales bacterium]|nr:hypothetical protein [Thermomicrobiales bacterium]
MSDYTPPPVGSIISADITTENADKLRDFYADAIGWSPSPVPMGDYDDYMMMTPEGAPAAGVCYLRGPNINQPANQWVVCFRVASVDETVSKVVARGGKVLGDVRPMGASKYAVIQDPVGGILSIFDIPVE